MWCSADPASNPNADKGRLAVAFGGSSDPFTPACVLLDLASLPASEGNGRAQIHVAAATPPIKPSHGAKGKQKPTPSNEPFQPPPPNLCQPNAKREGALLRRRRRANRSAAP